MSSTYSRFSTVFSTPRDASAMAPRPRCMGPAGGSNTMSSVHCDIIPATSFASANCMSRWLIASIARRSASRFVWICIEPPLDSLEDEDLLSRRNDERLTVYRDLVRPLADDCLGLFEDQFHRSTAGPRGLQHEFMAELNWMVLTIGLNGRLDGRSASRRVHDDLRERHGAIGQFELHHHVAYGHLGAVTGCRWARGPRACNGMARTTSDLERGV